MKKRDFVLHPKLLEDIIKRQTGSLDRAMLEAISNSIDAGATQVHVTFDRNALRVVDDGKGFTSEEEIERNFETFGRPHDVSEAKVFGTFRMGRGQLFAHGKNTWKTNDFQLRVDIESALGYDLTRLSPPLPGCEINVELYHPLLHADWVRILANFKKAVLWVGVPIFVNGQKVNEDPYRHDWEHRKDTFVASTVLNEPLEVFNVGIHVKTFPYGLSNVGGTILSTTSMALNFARNEPLDVCPVWQAVQSWLAEESMRLQALSEKKKQKTKSKGTASDFSRLQEIPRLTVPARVSRLKTIVSNKKVVDDHDFGQAMLLDGSKTGKHWLSPRKLAKLVRKTNMVVTIGHASDNHVYLAKKFGLATPISSAVLFRIGLSDTVKDHRSFVDALNLAFADKLKKSGRFVYLTKEEIVARAETYQKRITKAEQSAAEKTIVGAVSAGLVDAFDCFVPVELAVLGGDQSMRIEESTSGRTLLLSRNQVDYLGGDLSSWINLGQDVAVVLSRDSGKTDEKANLLALSRFLPKVPTFASVCAHYVCTRSETASAGMKVAHAKTLDMIERYVATGKNLALYRQTLEQQKSKLEALLAEWPDEFVGRLGGQAAS